MTYQPLGDWFPSGALGARASQPGLAAALWRVDQDELTQSDFAIPDETFFICVHLFGSMRWTARFPDRMVTTPVAPKTFCIARPGERGSIEHSDAHATFMHFHMNYARMRELLEPDCIDIRTIDFIDPRNAVDEEVDAIGRRVMEALPDGPTTRLRLDSAALSLTASLLERWSNFNRPLRTPSGLGRRDWRIRRVIELMESSLGEDWDLDTLAAEANLSPSHFVYLFRSVTGMSPHAFLIERRVKRACELLGDPRLAVTEVALACGFASSQHFATTFRKRVGATPSQYRRQRTD